MIEKLISEFSIANIRSFFMTKIESFKPIEDNFDWLFEEDSEITENYRQILKIGEARLKDSEELIVISAETSNELSERSAKKKQFEIAKKILKEERKEAAFFIFYDRNKNFRFSFISAKYQGVKRGWTSFKRFTYFVSSLDKTNKTFKTQIGRCGFGSIESILEAFKVEPLNEEFYREIASAFYNLVGGKLGTKDYAPLLKMPSQDIETAKKEYQEFAVRLIGRIIFIWFLKKKKSADGIPLIPKDWLKSGKVKSMQSYYHDLLEKLFFEILNKKIDERMEWLEPEHKQIPFLNGGLFQPQDEDYYKIAETGINGASKHLNTLIIPNIWFENLFETLERFNFTIDENSINDMEISIDPEMLGTIFEKLLAEIDPDTEKSERNSTGSFYTPREIVDYMAEESLVNYLKIETGIKEEELRPLFSEDKENSLHYSDNADIIIDALDRIKIFDPACGSGAFPIGILHKIGIILEKIDPNSAKWKERQIDKIADALLREEIKDKLDNSSVEYIRKLGVVRHSIFGADIQPIAIELSKLRCFLTLVAEEKIDDKKKNRGIFPLPNLELKFVTANTLIGLKSYGKEKKLDFGKTNEDIRKLAEIRDDYLHCKVEDKERFKKEFIEKRDEIARKELSGGVYNDEIYKITTWNPFGNKSADWFDSNLMFGVEKFDIVIGNPPYIQLQKAYNNRKKYADLYKDQNYKTFERTGDIYALFYEKGINLLEENGLLCYITSNKWMRAAYGKKLREFFVLKNPLRLIDLGPKVFASSTVDTNILLIQNNKPKKTELKAVKLNDKKKLTDSNLDFITLAKLDGKIWTIISSEQQRIKEKIEKIGTPLRDWDIKIYRGIVTGYNEAFIIDRKTRDKLTAEDPQSAEIIKPILRGKDIKRYKAEFADLWLIFIPWHFPLHKNSTISGSSKEAEKAFEEQYPAIYRHLLKYKDKLSKRNKDETGIRYEWYALQRCAASYYEEFEKEKIVYNDISQKLSFALCKKGIYFNNTVYFIANSKFNNYLIAALNTKLINWYYKRISAQLGKKAVRLFSIYVENIPIPQIPRSAQKPFEELVDAVIYKKEAGEDTRAEEKRIDIMTYELYRLTYDEVKIIDPEFDLTKEEYETA